jgi:hypothetical protein
VPNTPSISDRLNPEGANRPEPPRTPETPPVGEGIRRSEWDNLTELNPPSPHHPDTHTPNTPEGRTPESRAPETPAPETRAPESRTPEGRSPEGRAPESRAPEQGRQPEVPPYGQPQRTGPAARHQPEQPDYGQPQHEQPEGPPPQQGGPPPQQGGQPSQPDQGGQQGSATGGQDWRPGDAKFGVSDKPGFDPAFHHKALGDEWAPGVHDPEAKFSDKELAIADRLHDEGWRVDARPQDDSKQHMKNPESMVRKDPADEGLITEYKTLKSGESNAVNRNIKKASKQVPPDGEVVIDGRNVDLTKENADRAWADLEHYDDTRAAKVHVILGNGEMLTYVRSD